MTNTRAARVSPGITSAIGDTPLVQAGVLPNAWRLFIKLEKLNPGQSMKDRMALSIVERAEQRGELKPGGTIIESSSGNAATSLAMIAAARGYTFIAVVDSAASKEKVDAIRAYGAEVVLVGADSPEGYVSAAERLCEVQRLRERYPEAFFANQADNPDNALGYESLAEELVSALEPIDVLIGSMGSGGSLCGTGRFLRTAGQRPLVIGVEPSGSVIFGGPGAPYLQTGAGSPANLPLARNIDFGAIDRHYAIGDREAFNTARVLARTKGLLLGGTSGAVVYAALLFASSNVRGGNIVALAPDGGEKYRSTIFDASWMQQRELLSAELETYVVATLTD
jgi:cystathionine beta-synthase